MKKLFDIRDLKDRISGALKIGKRIYTVDAQCDEHLLALAVLHGAYLRIIEKEESTVFEVDATSEKIIIDKLREFGYEPRRKRSIIKPYKKRYGLFVGAAIFTAIFIILHEIGHLFAMWLFECSPKKINLVPQSIEIVRGFSNKPYGI